MKNLLKKSALSLCLFALILATTGCTALQGNDNSDEIKELQSQVKDLQTKLEEADQEDVVEDAATEDDSVTDVPTDDTTTETASETPENTTDSTPPKSTYTGESFITIHSPENESYAYESPIFFKGNVSPDAVRIGVKATNSKTTQVDDYVLKNYKPGSGVVAYGAAEKWDNLMDGTNTYIFTAYFDDNTSKSTKVTIYYTPGGAEMGKPVIYLYPKEKTQVFVNVKPTNGITVSEPTLGSGWNVWATPEGKITNISDNKVYPYLFWEGLAANFVTPKEGFVVAKKDVSSFFDKKLAYLGMNTKETADFKEYWVPLLSEKPYYFITFIDQATFDTYAPLTITPKPDSIIRVFFDYKGLDKKTTVTEQKLKAATRTGFSVIEWGGRLYR